MPNNLKCFEHFQTLFYGSVYRISHYTSVFRGPNTFTNCFCMLRRNLLKIHYFCRIGKGSILWTTVKDGGKAYLVYADLIKDIIFLAIIIKALGGIASVLSSTDWNFGNTVSLKEFSSYFHLIMFVYRGYQFSTILGSGKNCTMGNWY